MIKIIKSFERKKRPKRKKATDKKVPARKSGAENRLERNNKLNKNR